MAVSLSSLPARSLLPPPPLLPRLDFSVRAERGGSVRVRKKFFLLENEASCSSSVDRDRHGLRAVSTRRVHQEEEYLEEVQVGAEEEQEFVESEEDSEAVNIAEDVTQVPSLSLSLSVPVLVCVLGSCYSLMVPNGVC